MPGWSRRCKALVGSICLAIDGVFAIVNERDCEIRPDFERAWCSHGSYQIGSVCEGTKILSVMRS